MRAARAACPLFNPFLLKFVAKTVEQPHTIYTFLFWEEFKKAADRWGL